MIVAVDPYLIDWLDLVFRWLHVIAGIVWIGTSFYFVALDKHLRPRKDEEVSGISGDTWEIHGGGFCTFHEGARFFSYRRVRESGRMGAFIWIE